MLKTPRGYILSTGEGGCSVVDSRPIAFGRSIAYTQADYRFVMGHLDRWRKSLYGYLSPQRTEEGVRLRREVIRLYEAGNYRKAAEVARRLLEMQKRVLGEFHPDYATGLNNLSLLLQKGGDVAGAARLLDEVIAIRRVALGIDHPETIRSESLLLVLSDTPPALINQTLEPAYAAPYSVPVPKLEGPALESTSVPVTITSGLAGEVAPIAEAPPDARALAVLDGVLTLEHFGVGDLEGLRDCQEAACALREAVGAGISKHEADQLTKGDHPFAILLSFVERLESLSDAEWANSHESVSAAFGRGLARAVSRGEVRRARHSVQKARTD